MNTTKFWCRVLLLISIAFSSSAFAVAGKFQFVNGEVQVLDASGKARIAKKGDAIDQGETVASGTNGFAQIKMEDGGFFAVRPDTEFKIDTFKYEGKEDGSEKGVFSLIKGSLRSVTGVVGKKHKDNYKINTATATIGIRGSGADAGTGPNGTAVRTLFGGHTLTSGGKTIVTGPGQVAFAPPGGTPQYVPNFPFNTNTTGGGNNGGGNSGGAGGNNTSGGSANNGTPDNSPGVGNNDNVVIPIVDAEGNLNLTNLTQNGSKIGDDGGLADPTGIPGPLGSGGVTLALLQYNSGGQSFTYADQGVGVVDNSQFFSYIDANGNLVGWKLLETYTYNGVTTTYKDVVKVGSAIVVQDGFDPVNGVVWGRWSQGWESAYTETRNGVTEKFTDTPVGGLAFISAAHITTDAELANFGSWPLADGLISAGGIKGYYSTNGNTFPTALNGAPDGGHITSGHAMVNFTTSQVMQFHVSGSGGAFGSWMASNSGPASITDFKSNVGIGLSGSCSAGSGACAGMGTTINGRAVGTLVNTQAQGIISTVGLQAINGGTTDNMGGVVYLQRNSGAVP